MLRLKTLRSRIPVWGFDGLHALLVFSLAGGWAISHASAMARDWGICLLYSVFVTYSLKDVFAFGTIAMPLGRRVEYLVDRYSSDWALLVELFYRPATVQVEVVKTLDMNVPQWREQKISVSKAWGDIAWRLSGNLQAMSLILLLHSPSSPFWDK